VPTELERLAAKVRILFLDVDGVLTDGGLYYDVEGRIMKRFDVKDGLGIKTAQKAGLEIVVLTGLDHAGVAERVRELGITEYVAGRHRKSPLVEDVLARRGLTPEEAAYLGDDWVDAGPMGLVGLPMAVADAVPEIKALARYTTTRPGGRGAVREAIAFILSAQGRYAGLFAHWTGA